MLLLTVVVGSGALMIEPSSGLEEFQSGTTESQKLDYIEDNYQDDNQNTTTTQVILRGDNVLSKDTLIATLETEQAILQNRTVNRTLTGERPVSGVANSIALTAIQDRETPSHADNTSIEGQIVQLESMNESQINSTIQSTLGGDGEDSALQLMPKYYEEGDTSANATVLLVSQKNTEGEGVTEEVSEAHTAMQAIAEQKSGANNVMVFSSGMVTDEFNSAIGDSLLIVGPLAILLVLLALTIAYRDIVDIGLGIFGIGAVMAWAFGIMGWAGIPFNDLMIAVPVLLIGLSIDYAIHIFMRHREKRADKSSENSVRKAMKVALVGVGTALIWVTVTAAIGFLSNLFSPVPPIQNFGIISAVGLVSALLVFGVLVPAMKIEIDSFLESRGWNREKKPLGTGGSHLNKILSIGSTAARKAPIVVLVVTLLVSGVGAYGGMQVDTSFSQENSLPEDPSSWMKDLPEPFAPNDYTVKNDLSYINDNFLSQDSQAQILVEGDLTNPDTLAAIERGTETASSSPATQKLSNGDVKAQSPLAVMERVAANNEQFAETFRSSDTDGDGVPDEDLEAVYKELFSVAPEPANNVIERTDSGEYVSARLVISTQGDASGSEVTSEMRAIATAIEADSNAEATATGDTIVNEMVRDQLLDTVFQGLLSTLAAVSLLLMAIYRKNKRSATLGVVTVLPVVFSVSWILGTMYLIDIPFNYITGMITSLTIGLGVAYSIHLSERYILELEQSGSMQVAMHRAVTGTGGALLGSAVTTVSAFGVLAFALAPPLQQFGITTGLTIIYAFLASVFILPSLLVLWTRYFGPDDVEEMSLGGIESGLKD